MDTETVSDGTNGAAGATEGDSIQPQEILESEHGTAEVGFMVAIKKNFSYLMSSY